MKNLIRCSLATILCASAVYAEESPNDSKKDVNNSANVERTWDDGRPMSDKEYEHMLDVMRGFDSN